MIERILQLIKERDITAYKLTSEIGLDSGIISHWKKGKVKPSTEAIIKIALYFNVSTDYLLGLSDEPTPQKKEAEKQDEINYELSKLTPEKLEKAKSYIKFLKTEQDFQQELQEKLNIYGMESQPQ